jgi:flagellar motor switch protein FliG
MSMLDRYKKPGGFVQLLALVETCGQAKQEKFLEIISKEDSHWADAIKKKMLSIERIYSWPDEQLAEIFGTLQDLTVAVALYAANDSIRNRINGYFSHGRKRKIDDLFGTSKPSAPEIAATHMKIIESVRKMEQDGFLRLEKFDADLEVAEDIEERLAKAAAMAPEIVSLNFGGFDQEPSTESSKTDAPSSNEGSESRIMEIQSLKKRVAELSKESAMLRHELSLARAKLDQIKKIA